MTIRNDAYPEPPRTAVAAPLRVVVTGAAGFIGSHLCERLVASGCRVLAIDDFSTGVAANLDALREHPRFALRCADISQAIPPEVDDAAFIYNLACPPSPAYYQRRPVHTVLTSTLGTWRLLESACRSGARLLQASTSEVYGDPEQHPQSETYWGHVNPTGPRSCYDEGKRCAEAMCYAYHRERGVQVRVARIFNTYGPRLLPADGRVVSNFIVQALRAEPLTVYGAGAQTRSFCYVDDTVDALVRLMHADVTEPVNVGNPAEISVLELASAVLAATGSRSELVFQALPVDDPRRRCPDIARARALGWGPSVDLAQGLSRTVDYFRALASDRSAGRDAPAGVLTP